MKIHENFNVKGIFHHDKNSRVKVCTHIFSKYAFQVCITYIRYKWL